MMWWNGGWAWLMMLPMTVLLWALIALVLVPWTRTRKTHVLSPRQLLDERLAAGDIGIDEYRTRRTELERSG